MPSVPFGKEMKLPNNLNEMATPRLGEPLGYEGSDSAADKLVLFVPARLNGLVTGQYLLAGLPWLSLAPEPVDTRARLRHLAVAGGCRGCVLAPAAKRSFRVGESFAQVATVSASSSLARQDIRPNLMPVEYRNTM
ncbi:predicted protein [Chaetomium globosum CBS 148.51]|uniref:Uncharacterized protein n=1 Tax=Chaetomium globosum (strain ATCC 6205 / CBS 148.51 / DSM 1962 / NBRC 6347 / NRRL 1970) TaxID=306901 RepID=Q2GY39_CHAGB|nr:uncharacterized protein CHGG_07115 [Chaetomium globosum CBS 148.51]EAQ85862.1 predicted protein [Chaetomium globosum CBS 148.51]